MEVVSDKNEGRLKSILNVDDSVPVIISKTNCNQTGLYQPSKQQKKL